MSYTDILPEPSIFTLYNSYNKEIKRLYQWDVSVGIYIKNWQEEGEVVCYFNHPNGNKALAVVPQVVEELDGTKTLTCKIPNRLLQKSKDIEFYIVFKDSNELLTQYRKVLDVCGRPQPENYIPEDDPDYIVLEILIEEVETLIDDIRAALERGDFDGYSPSASVERVEGGVKVSITDKEGTTTAVVNDGEPGTTNYRELSNKPREVYIPSSEGVIVNFLDLANGKIYDCAGNFTLAKMQNNQVVTSVDIHDGDIFCVSRYNSTDGFSTISVFCNFGLFNFQSNISDWSYGFTINGEDFLTELIVKKLPVSGTTSGSKTVWSCDISTLEEGIYYTENLTTLTGWVSGTLNASKGTLIKKINGVLFVDNSYYIDYDLTTRSKIYVETGDVVQETGQNINKVMSQKATTDAISTAIASIGTVFRIKGSKATASELPLSGDAVGDVWYVEDESVGYIWINDDGNYRWEKLGETVDLSNYYTKSNVDTLLGSKANTSDVNTALAGKQDSLVSGTNIKSLNNESLLGSGNIDIKTTTEVVII